MAGLVSHSGASLRVILRCFLVRMVTFVRRVLLSSGWQSLRMVGGYSDIGSGLPKDTCCNWLVRVFSTCSTDTPYSGVGFHRNKHRFARLHGPGHMEFRQDLGGGEFAIGGLRGSCIVLDGIASST